jgi:hypothetical protein
VVSLGGVNLGLELAQNFLKRALYTLLCILSVIGSKLLHKVVIEGKGGIAKS